MSEQYDHYRMGTHPVTGAPWAYCIACPSGNGPTIEALRAACRRTCARRHAEDGMLKLHEDSIELTRQGLLQVDGLLPVFFEPEHQGVRYT